MILSEAMTLVAISGSGNSPNVLLAVDYARSLGCPVIGLIGFDGGKLRERVDVAVRGRATGYRCFPPGAPA